MATEVRDNQERSRYELLVDGDVVGVADYVAAGTTVVVFPHTEIDPDLRGQGFGAILVRYALDDVRAAGHTVDPQCWYVAQFIDTNPQYQDLLAA